MTRRITRSMTKSLTANSDVPVQVPKWVKGSNLGLVGNSSSDGNTGGYVPVDTGKGSLTDLAQRVNSKPATKDSSNSCVGKCSRCNDNIGEKQNWILCNTCGGKLHRTCLPEKLTNYAFSELRKTLFKCKKCVDSNASCIVCDELCDCEKCCLPPVDCNISELFEDFLPEELLRDTNSENSLPEFNCFNFNSVKGLKFGHLNINGLRKKFDDFRDFLVNFNFNLFSLNELRVSENYIPSFYDIPNYTFLPFVKSSRGGSCFYIRNDSSFREIVCNVSFPKFAEVNVIELKIPYSKPIIVVNIYNSPSVDKLDFLNCLNLLLIELSQINDNILIMGDFNIDLKVNNGNSYLLKSLARQFNLEQVITEPTHFNDESETLIDHIYASHYFKNNYAGVFDVTNSDHKAVYIIKHNIVPKIPYKIITTRNLSNLDFDLICTELDNIDWSELHAINNPDDILDYFEAQVIKIIDKYAPMSKRRVKGFRNPWMTKLLMKLRCQRDDLKKLWHKTKSQSDKKEYTRFKHYVQNEMN